MAPTPRNQVETRLLPFDQETLIITLASCLKQVRRSQRLLNLAFLKDEKDLQYLLESLLREQNHFVRRTKNILARRLADFTADQVADQGAAELNPIDALRPLIDEKDLSEAWKKRQPLQRQIRRGA